MAPSLNFVASLLLLPSLISAQSVQYTLLPSNLPACTQQCSAITLPANNCVPPVAPVQATTDPYLSCFCNFNSLQGLKTSTTNVCQGICSDTDFAQILSFYRSTCGVPNGQTTLATTTTPAATAATSPATSASATDASDTGPDFTASNNESWFSTHWKWVVMIIVLAIGLIVISVLGTWLHRRAQRRRDANVNPGNRSTPEVWGTGQHDVHNVGGVMSNNSGLGASEKGKSRQVQSDVTQVESNQEEKKRKKRLRRN